LQKTGSAHRYPNRIRCFKCRNYLCLYIIKGLYCSYKCAGMIDPLDIPQEQWPRQHVVKWKFPLKEKRHYFSLEEGLEAARRNGSKSAYYDNFCGTWHIGTWRTPSGSPPEVDGALPEG